MKWAVIATWAMAENGVRIASKMLKNEESAADAITEGVCDVEDNPSYHSVGCGGRPNRDCRVFLDGGFMDGDSLHFGAVGAVEGYRSAVRIARSLLKGDANNFLVGSGAEKYAEANGFEKRDNLTEEGKAIWQAEKDRLKQLSAYDGHDTVCFLAKDQKGTLCAATSTSGLFMKEEGRLGDTPVPGSGFYADSKTGAAAATGMGEEIMKGALSFAAVMYMKQGMSAMEAAQKAVNDLDKELKERNGYAQPMSLVALDKEGNIGVGTNVEFTFVYADEKTEPAVYTAVPLDGKTVIGKRM